MLRSAVSRTGLRAVGQSGLGGSSSHAEGMHPNLGLHNAAATGNIGLVKFALENGQPANSNLNGILPLHAACSGGSEQSARMLIFYGADVNAPRLKVKGSTGPGAEGSTPLHFAAANGHTEIVRMLLEAGARPAAADKEGVTPEALALGNGHIECANLIRSWISAYGSNGLAGMVESRETVSGDVSLGPAGYIRYEASGRSASPLSPTATPRGTSTTPTNTHKSSTTPASSLLSTNPSSQLLTTNNGSKLTGPRSSGASKGGSLSKTSSNPNLRNQVSFFTTPPMPVASPLPISESQAQLASANTASASSSGLGGPHSNDHDADTAPSATRSTIITSAAAAGNVANASTTGSLRESKRRPSLPSILEKAAHPAASLRAALAAGSSTQMSGSLSQASASKYFDQSYDGITASPGKKHSRLAGKRSLSNMLRKATGSTTGSNPSSALTSSSSFFGDASASSSTSLLSGGAINMDALAKPGRVSGKSFDYQRPPASLSQRALRRNTASESSNEDPDAFRVTTAPSHQTSFDQPHLPVSQSDAAALDLQRRLRSASSSSSLSAAREQHLADSQVRRARAGSNEQPASLSAHNGSRLPSRGNASLDLLRPGFGQIGDKSSRSIILAGTRSATGGSNQTNRNGSLQRAGAASAQGFEASTQQAEAPVTLPTTTGRGRSVSGSSSLSAGTTDNDRSLASSTVEETADEDDLQEFLDHSSEPEDRTLDGGESHDAHRLPASLRTMTALREQNAKGATDSSAIEAATSNATLHGFSSPNDDSARLALNSSKIRDRSGSHVSALSSGSQSSGSVRGMGSGSIEAGPRSSPSLAASYQALSVAEENGLSAHTGLVHGAGSSTTTSRASRAPSVAESVTSHASSSSLRSNYLSAAEQAQAILNHETPYASDRPDGTSTSLAAQLAAYGEALAMERKRAGDARTGPSPSLSARGSNAALRPKLPSVSEDQSPSRSATQNERSFGSVSDNHAPKYPATAAESYNRRLSRRPHSSEGRPDNATPGSLGSASTSISQSRLERVRSQGHAASRNASSLKPASQTSPWDSERSVSPNLAGPPGLGSNTPVQATEHGLEAGRQSAQAIEPQATASGGDLALQSQRTSAPGKEKDAAPKVPPKDQRRLRHGPVVLNAFQGLTTKPDVPDKQEAVVDDEDEDDPKTPVIGGSKAMPDKFAASPRTIHQHSPSLPTELSSYTPARRERSPGPTVLDDSASLTQPVPPPRKDSINVPALSGLGLEGSSSEGRMLSPDPAMWKTWREAEDVRRPSLNMLRSATSSSTHSQTPSHTSSLGEEYGHSRWSTDETVAGGKGEQQSSPVQQQGGGGGKRRLVQNLLKKAKGGS